MLYSILISLIIVPFSLLTFFYGSIFKKIKNSLSLGLTAPHFNDVDTQMIIIRPTKIKMNKKLNDLRLSLKFAEGLFVSFLVYSIAIVPFCLVNMLDYNHKYASYIHLYPWFLVRSWSSFNPIIYPFYHSSFRFGCKNVINVVVHKRKLVAPKNRNNKKKTRFKIKVKINLNGNKQIVI